MHLRCAAFVLLILFPTYVFSTDCNYGSPVVIDTTGKGIKFTDPSRQCVMFDVFDNQEKIPCISWPIAGSGNAWLALPDENGRVHSGKQLFGSDTPQPHHKSDFPNGFLALAEYDSNYDLVISASDPVWSKLRLWIDTHCYMDRSQPCESLPSELHTLDLVGISNIGLVYQMSAKVDQWNNTYRWESLINIDTSRDDRQHSKDKLGRTAYTANVKSLQACK